MIKLKIIILKIIIFKITMEAIIKQINIYNDEVIKMAVYNIKLYVF
jgi:hypothetical protein